MKRALRRHQFDQQVVLQSRSTAIDGAGQHTITWVTEATVWAQVQAVRGREFFAAAQVQQEQTLKVRINYRTDVQLTWRLQWQGLNHDITGIIPVGRGDMLELMCLQGVKDGR